MTVETEILETVSHLPESLKNKLLDYAHHLLETYSGVEPEQIDTVQQKKKRCGFGILKDKIWMAENFDEPLEDLKEYM